MKFYDDEPVECDHCGEIIYAPAEYYRYKNENFCSYSCLGEVLIDEHYNEIQKRDLLTAEDHEGIYGDMEYDRLKDEGLL